MHFVCINQYIFVRSFLLLDEKNNRMFTMGDKSEMLYIETKPVDSESVVFTHPSAAAKLVVKVPTASDKTIVK